MRASSPASRSPAPPWQANVEKFVCGKGLADDDRAEIARLPERMERELARETPTRWNLKTGRGGLVDVEFAVQMMQLRHGHDHPAIRERRTKASRPSRSSTSKIRTWTRSLGASGTKAPPPRLAVRSTSIGGSPNDQ